MLSGVTGRIAEGLSADLLVVPGNPLENIDLALRNPVVIVCAGQFVEPCARTAALSRRSHPVTPSWTRAAVDEPQPCPCVQRMKAAALADARA